jgi:WD40 repeat protein
MDNLSTSRTVYGEYGAQSGKFTMTDSRCPSPAELSTYAMGKLSEHDSDVFERHLQGCTACQVAINEFDESGDQLVRLIRAGEPKNPFVDEWEFKSGIGRCLLVRQNSAGLMATGPLTSELAPFDENLPVMPDFEILGKIGAGGMGSVYKAWHKRLERPVAIKVSDTAVERFRQEQRAGGKLIHPNVVMVHDARHEGGRDVLIMEYVDGQDLGTVLQQRGRLTVKQAVDCVLQAARGLEYAHRLGVIHRDVKPRNLMLDKDGIVKLLDLGLAHFEGFQDAGVATPNRDRLLTDLTKTGQVMGSVHFMSPEQTENAHDVDCRADIYSLGCTLYLLLIGKPPYEGPSVGDIVDAHRHAPIPSLCAQRDDVPEELDCVFQKMVAKSRTDRQQDMSQVICELEACPIDEPVDRDLTKFLKGVAQPERVFVVKREELGKDTASGFAAAADTVISAPKKSHAKRMKRYLPIGAGFAVAIVCAVLYFWPPGPISKQSGVPPPPPNRMELVATIRRPSGPVFSLAYSPNDEFIAAAEGTFIRIWDARTGLGRPPIQGHTDQVTFVCFSPDGTRLASASNDQTVRLWDPLSGRHLFTLPGHTLGVRCLAFSADGKTLATGSDDSNIIVWDLDKKTPLHNLSGHKAAVNWLAFSPAESSKLLSASADRTIKLWDLQTGTLLQSLADHFESVNSLTVSPDGRRFVSGAGENREGVIKIWDTKTTQLLKSFEGHIARVVCVAYSPDGRAFASGAGDGQVKIWESGSGRELLAFQAHAHSVNALCYSHDGKSVVSSANEEPIKVWDAESGRRVRHLNGNAQGYLSAAFSPDGKTLAAACTDGYSSGFVRLWDIPSGEERVTFPQEHVYSTDRSSLIQSIAFSPDGLELATASEDGTVRLWNAVTGEVRETFSHGQVVALAFSPDGKSLASGGLDKVIRIRDVESGNSRFSLSGHSDAVTCLDFSPDGAKLASASNDETVRLWDANSGQLHQVFRGHVNRVTCLRFSPSGNTLVSAGRNRKILVWDIATSGLLRTLQAHDDEIKSVVFLGHDAVLASAGYDRQIRLWDIATGSRLQVLTGHTDNVYCLAASVDGNLLASASKDGTIKLWKFVRTEHATQQ